MSDTSTLLATLADVQVPAPPAQGASLLLLLNTSLLLTVLVALWWRWHRHRTCWRREAIAALHQARHQETEESLLTAASVLRQVACYRLGDEVSELHGEGWLQTLDACFDTHWFTEAQGRVFGASLYAPKPLASRDLNSLINTLERMLRRLPSRIPRAPPIVKHDRSAAR